MVAPVADAVALWRAAGVAPGLRMLRPLAMEERRDKVGLRKEGEAPGPEREMRCRQRHITSAAHAHSTQHTGEQRNGTAMTEAKG